MKKIINIRKRVICLGLCLGLIINQMMILHCNKVIAVEADDSDFLDFSYSTSDSLYDTFGQPDMDSNDKKTEKHSKVVSKSISADAMYKDLEAKETWSKVSEHIYLDKNSVDVQKNGYVSGLFKQYFSKETQKNGKITSYKTIQIATICNINPTGNSQNTKILEHPIYKYYDFENNLIAEDNIYKNWAKEHPNQNLGITTTEKVENGEIYFQNLCNAYYAAYPEQGNIRNIVNAPQYNGQVQNNTSVNSYHTTNTQVYNKKPKKKKSYAERYKEKYGVSIWQAILFGAAAGIASAQKSAAARAEYNLREQELMYKYMPRFTDIQMPQQPKTYKIYDGYSMGTPRWTIKEGY